MKLQFAPLAIALLTMPWLAAAQTTTLSVVVGPEASLTVGTGTTSLTSGSTNFSGTFNGTTNLTYMIRTTKVSGSGTITAKVTTDFTAGGPSVTTPPTAGDTLTYVPTVSTPGTAAASQTASTSAYTPVATFGPAANSAKAGNSASVAWALTDDPLYATGTYTATTTFAISSL